jgi:hypothetical protein
LIDDDDASASAVEAAVSTDFVVASSDAPDAVDNGMLVIDNL